MFLEKQGSNSSTDSGSGANGVNVAIASKPDAHSHSHLEPESPMSDNSRKTSSDQQHQQQQQQVAIFRQQLEHLQIPEQLEMDSEGGSPITTGGSSYSQQAPKPFSEKVSFSCLYRPPVTLCLGYFLFVKLLHCYVFHHNLQRNNFFAPFMASCLLFNMHDTMK